MIANKIGSKTADNKTFDIKTSIYILIYENKFTNVEEVAKSIKTTITAVEDALNDLIVSNKIIYDANKHKYIAK